MKNIILISLISIFFFDIYGQNRSKLIVNIRGLRNNNGYVLIALFNDPDGFPGKKEKAFMRFKKKIKNNLCGSSMLDPALVFIPA